MAGSQDECGTPSVPDVPEGVTVPAFGGTVNGVVGAEPGTDEFGRC